MPIQSHHKPIELPEIDLFSFLFRRPSQRCPAQQVMFQDAEDSRRKYTFKDLETDAVNFGAGLRDNFGIRKGDVIAVVSPNDIDMPAIVFGIISIGAISTAINPGYAETEMTHHLKTSDAKLIVVHSSVLETIRVVCRHICLPETCIFLVDPPSGQAKSFRHWRDAQIKDSIFTPPPISPKTDVATLLFSSGTTGLPKGVMTTHYNATSDLLQMIKQETGREYRDTYVGFGTFEGIQDAPPEGDKILGCLPFFHSFGMSQLMNLAIFLGVTTVVMKKFRLEDWCQLVEQHKITVSYIVPAMALQLAKHPRVPEYDLSSIRMLTSGASPLSKQSCEDLYQRFGLRIKQGYGATEMSPASFMPNWSKWRDCLGGNGRLFPNMEAKFCRIQDEDEFDASQISRLPELPSGEVGELYCKGPNIFPGYWKAPEATATCRSADGWFRTGDVGYLDENSCLFITDRAKDLIKYKGFQVAPAELEGILAAHEDIEDVAVVGVWSERDNAEVPRAYVVLKGGLEAVQPGEDKKLAAWLAARVIYYKKLRGGIKFVESILRNTNGKILRRSLKVIAQREFNEERSYQVRSNL